MHYINVYIVSKMFVSVLITKYWRKNKDPISWKSKFWKIFMPSSVKIDLLPKRLWLPNIKFYHILFQKGQWSLKIYKGHSYNPKLLLSISKGHFYNPKLFLSIFNLLSPYFVHLLHKKVHASLFSLKQTFFFKVVGEKYDEYIKFVLYMIILIKSDQSRLHWIWHLPFLTLLLLVPRCIRTVNFKVTKVKRSRSQNDIYKTQYLKCSFKKLTFGIFNKV